MRMDIKNFHIAAEDEKNYTLAHPNGRQFIVDKSSLTERARKAISSIKGEPMKMNEGGVAPTSASPGTPININIGTPQAQPQQEPGFRDLIVDGLKNMVGYKDPNASVFDKYPQGPQPDANGMVPYNMPPMTEEEAGRMMQMNGVGAPQQPVIPQLQAQPNMMQSMAPVAQPQIAPQQAMDPMLQKNVSMDQLYTQQQEQIKKFADAQSQAANSVSNAYKSYSKMMEEMKTPQQIMEADKAGNDALMKAYQEKEIDPDRYMKNKVAGMSTGQKILSILAIAFGGAGAAVARQPNFAMQHLDNAIAQDIEAQKRDQDKSQNLWKMNMQNYGNKIQANLATQNQLWTGVQAKIGASQAAAQGPQAQAQAAQLINQIEQQKIQNRQMLGLMSAPSGASGKPGQHLSGADPAYLVNSMVTEPQARKEVLTEIKHAQLIKENGAKIMDAFNRAAQDNTVMRTGAGMLRTPGSVMQLHQLILPNFMTIDGTIREEAKNETFKNVTPAPGDSDQKIEEKRQALQDWLHSHSKAPTAKSYGIDLERFASTNSYMPEQPKIQMYKGQPYQLSPDGKSMVKVKR